jgi:hypothetical protein
MLASDGTAKLIDLGSCRVAGILEIASPLAREEALGTLQYAAPEYRFGRAADRRADAFSLACVCYEMLTGSLPYGEAFERVRTREQFARLRYRSASALNPLVPTWLDGALERAVQLEPERRYAELAEWLHDLEHTQPGVSARRRAGVVRNARKCGAGRRCLRSWRWRWWSRCGRGCGADELGRAPLLTRGGVPGTLTRVAGRATCWCLGHPGGWALASASACVLACALRARRVQRDAG